MEHDERPSVAVGFELRKARSDDGRTDDSVWQSSARAPVTCEPWRQRQKGTTDNLASSVADFVKNLFVGRFRLRCDRTLDHGGGGESEGEDA